MLGFVDKDGTEKGLLGQTWVRDSVGKYHVGNTLRLLSFK